MAEEKVEDGATVEGRSSTIAFELAWKATTGLLGLLAAIAIALGGWNLTKSIDNSDELGRLRERLARVEENKATAKDANMILSKLSVLETKIDGLDARMENLEKRGR